MFNIKSVLFLLLGTLLLTVSCEQKTNSSVRDYLNTGSEILFNNTKYKLAWSSNPSDNYYKQEYLAEGDSLDNFKEMILIDVIAGKSQLKEAVNFKVAELKKMKDSDPMVNYDVFEKDGEVMIDFLLSKKVPDSNISDILERNVYRYSTFTDSNGDEGVLMFGISERAYGDNIDIFLSALKNDRFALPNAVGTYAIPEIKITK